MFGGVGVSPGAVAVLAEFTPRVNRRAVEKAAAAALAGGEGTIQAEDIEATLGLRAKTSAVSTSFEASLIPTRRFNTWKTQWRRVKSVPWQVLRMAGERIVFLRRRGRPEVAFMPAATARFGVLCAYVMGRYTRSQTMSMRGMDWYGDLVIAMRDAGLRVQVDPRESEVRIAKFKVVLKEAGGPYETLKQTNELIAAGLPHRRTRLEAADMLSAGEASELMGLSGGAVTRAVAEGKLLGFHVAGLGIRLPSWQFPEPMSSAMLKVISGLGTRDPWSVRAFLERPHGALGGRTPRAAIEQGDLERVMSLAMSESRQLPRALRGLRFPHSRVWSEA